MKAILKMFAVIAWALTGCMYGAESGVHLFILSGQSNMDGVNPDISFTPTVVDKFGKDNVVVVKDAKSGGPIRFWYKKADVPKGQKTSGWLYDRLMGKVAEAMKGKVIKTVTFIWMQGEADSTNNGKNYGAQLRGVLEQLREDLQYKNIHVVVGRISDHGFENEKKYPQWTLVRQALVDLAESEPYGAWVNTDDLNDKTKDGKTWNDLHYSGPGYVTLGKRFAEKAIELIQKPKN